MTPQVSSTVIGNYRVGRSIFHSRRRRRRDRCRVWIPSTLTAIRFGLWVGLVAAGKGTGGPRPARPWPLEISGGILVFRTWRKPRRWRTTGLLRPGKGESPFLVRCTCLGPWPRDLIFHAPKLRQHSTKRLGTSYGKRFDLTKVCD